jgi:hypothetical protein
VTNLKLIYYHQRHFVTTLKSNHMVSLRVACGYVPLEQGQIVKFKELPFKVKLFKLVAINGDIGWVITNHPSLNITHVVKTTNSVCWQIKQFYRELKQLTGSEKCKSHRGRAECNPITLCYQAWLVIKVAIQKLTIVLVKL